MPGTTSFPSTLITLVSGPGLMFGETWDMAPSWTATSNCASIPCDGSMTLPPLSRRSVMRAYLRQLKAGHVKLRAGRAPASAGQALHP